MPVIASIVDNLRNLKWGEWLYVLIAAGVSAGAGALIANPLASALGAQQFTPRQLAINALSLAIVAMAGILHKSPLPDRRETIALLPGVHTSEDVTKVLNATSPGTVPTPGLITAILAVPPKVEAPKP